MYKYRNIFDTFFIEHSTKMNFINYTCKFINKKIYEY